jgi:hypothetical protein
MILFFFLLKVFLSFFHSVILILHPIGKRFPYKQSLSIQWKRLHGLIFKSQVLARHDGIPIPALGKLALGKLRQVDCEFQASLGYIA